MTTYTGYHFSDGCEAYGSRRKIKAGVTLRVKPPLRMCKHGLHWSKRVIDALAYGSGPILSIIEASGETLHDTDKSCSEVRTHIQVFDATNLLHEFACWCAERALRAERKAGQEPDKRSWEAIRVKRRWLKGQVTDEQLSAAVSDAARAVRAAVRAAASAAAWAAASAAAWAAEIGRASCRERV